RLLGDRRAELGIRAGPGDDALTLTLAAPYPEAARLLASPRAGIAVARGGALAGTGPFMAAPQGGGSSELVLAPFVLHRAGRPFLDTLRFTAVPSAFGAKERLERGEASVALGPFDLEGGALAATRAVRAR